MKFLFIAVFVCLVANAHGARFLFDATHAETAGSADWVIDADLHNLSWSANPGTFTTSSGNDSNAQRIPTPAASGIMPSTSETYWQGALSAWAVDLVKRGHSVETLPTSPAAVPFTYGTAGVQDLTNYDVVVIDEPNIAFTLAEKQALLSFVANGGSLFMISDHVGSDRDNNGIDSVGVWNDFLTNNGVTNNPFGILYRTTGSQDNASGENTFARTVAGDPICFGPLGTSTNILYSNGDEFQLDPTKNPTVISHLWFGASSDSNNFCAIATAQYGNGRVVACGDSSPFDDGTGDPNDSLFTGYTGDINGAHRPLILNCSEWLAAPFAAPTASVGVTNVTPSCGPTAGKTSVTISGSNFVSGATVTIGGISASNVVVVGSNSITALSPTNTVGAKIVQVTNVGGKFGALTNGFTYVTVLSFAGLSSATPATEAATLSWSAGTGAMSYNVFQATTSGAENYGSPALTTNVVSVLVAPLYPGSNSPITYFFVVRAMDGCGNPDTNTVEKSVQPLLDPNKDQDGDGIPNGFEQAYGLNPFNAADANADSDGDGMSNLQEYLAGTDPTNGASAFRITSVAQETNGVRVTWMTGLNKTNALQSTTGWPDGSYSNNFTDLYIVTNTISVTTNYLDQSMTNLPARYYRVRLVP